MTKRNFIVFIEDILQSISNIESYTKNLSFEEFDDNQMIIDAVIRNIEIIGEAARNVPQEVKERFEKIPWKKMIGLRNLTIHEYFGIDLSIIWHVFKKELPSMEPLLKKVLEVDK